MTGSRSMLTGESVDQAPPQRNQLHALLIERRETLESLAQHVLSFGIWPVNREYTASKQHQPTANSHQPTADPLTGRHSKLRGIQMAASQPPGTNVQGI